MRDQLQAGDKKIEKVAVDRWGLFPPGRTDTKADEARAEAGCGNFHYRSRKIRRRRHDTRAEVSLQLDLAQRHPALRIQAVERSWQGPYRGWCVDVHRLVRPE